MVNPYLGDNLVTLGLVEACDRRLKQIHGEGPYEIVYVSPAANKVLKPSPHLRLVDWPVEEALGFKANTTFNGKLEYADSHYDADELIHKKLDPLLDEHTLVFHHPTDGQLDAHLQSQLPDAPSNHTMSSSLIARDGLFAESLMETLQQSLELPNGASGVATLGNGWVFKSHSKNPGEVKGPSSPEHNENGSNTYLSWSAINNLSELPHPGLVDSRFLPEALSAEQLQAHISEAGLDPMKPFVFLNYNSGQDKARTAPYSATYLLPIINYLREKHPGVNIILTSPQPYHLAPEQQKLYEQAQSKIANQVESWNEKQQSAAGKKAIMEISHDNFPLLSAAIRDSRLVLSQDTGAVHFANIVKAVPLQGPSVPKVISFAPRARRWELDHFGRSEARWQIPSQPFIADLSFGAGEVSRDLLYAAIEASLSEKALPSFFGRKKIPDQIPTYRTEFEDLFRATKNIHFEVIDALLEHPGPIDQRATYALANEIKKFTGRVPFFDTDVARKLQQIVSHLDRMSLTPGQVDFADPTLRYVLIREIFNYFQAYARALKRPQEALPEFPPLGDDFWSALFRNLKGQHLHEVVAEAIENLPPQTWPSREFMEAFISRTDGVRLEFDGKNIADFFAQHLAKSSASRRSAPKHCEIFGSSPR